MRPEYAARPNATRAVFCREARAARPGPETSVQIFQVSEAATPDARCRSSPCRSFRESLGPGLKAKEPLGRRGVAHRPERAQDCRPLMGRLIHRDIKPTLVAFTTARPEGDGVA